jgi:hypothetical protein
MKIQFPEKTKQLIRRTSFNFKDLQKVSCAQKWMKQDCNKSPLFDIKPLHQNFFILHSTTWFIKITILGKRATQFRPENQQHARNTPFSNPFPSLSLFLRRDVFARGVEYSWWQPAGPVCHWQKGPAFPHISRLLYESWRHLLPCAPPKWAASLTLSCAFELMF